MKAPVDTCCLVLVAEGVDKRRSLTKLLLSKATVVECAGPADAVEAAKWVRDRVAQDGMTIDAAGRAAGCRSRRARTSRGCGPTSSGWCSTPRATKAITEADVREVVGAGDIAGRLGRDAAPSNGALPATRCASWR